MTLPKTRQEAIDYLPGKSFDDLSLQWKTDLAAMRPAKGKTFTQEQRDAAKDFWLEIPPEKMPELIELNQGKTVIVFPIKSTDGRNLVSLDILTDIRQGESFFYLLNFLKSLKICYWVAPSNLFMDAEI